MLTARLFLVKSISFLCDFLLLSLFVFFFFLQLVKYKPHRAMRSELSEDSDLGDIEDSSYGRSRGQDDLTFDIESTQRPETLLLQIFSAASRSSHHLLGESWLQLRPLWGATGTTTDIPANYEVTTLKGAGEALGANRDVGPIETGLAGWDGEDLEVDFVCGQPRLTAQHLPVRGQQWMAGYLQTATQQLWDRPGGSTSRRPSKTANGADGTVSRDAGDSAPGQMGLPLPNGTALRFVFDDVSNL